MLKSSVTLLADDLQSRALCSRRPFLSCRLRSLVSGWTSHQSRVSASNRSPWYTLFLSLSLRMAPCRGPPLPGAEQHLPGGPASAAPASECSTCFGSLPCPSAAATWGPRPSPVCVWRPSLLPMLQAISPGPRWEAPGAQSSGVRVQGSGFRCFEHQQGHGVSPSAVAAH